ncbi:aldo/keto reductase [Thioclava sp. SK-1]|uniref:aldo/keto reductase n=1 Tax=Thioclava sp. SK-1 TaxID=1889770 RepID=UPI00082402E6|nr:aldo/keto reductase [Thioclava sp. SK-1]OCX64696.1 aldo/keto reductase [Thioclava sp. SK-1]
MRKVKLGRTDLDVSEICLGSMTWGSQDHEDNGHAQIDYALERGVDFIDTAEMYPVNPVKAETAGRTEEIIGNWLTKTGKRKDVVIATKIAGGGGMIRNGEEMTADSVTRCIDASLKRLQTDYIDLYQFHWPNRGSYHFRQNWKFAPDTQPGADQITANMIDCLGALETAVKAGKIRHFGLSNESAWGMAKWLELAEAGHGPRAATIQNEYSLMCRLYDLDLAELGHHEDVTLLAYSPLAVGMLSGKYADGAVPANSRLEANGNLGGRANPRAFAIADKYVAVAKEHGLHPVTMANAWTLQRPFPCLPIIGARSIEQLGPVLDAAGQVLSEAVMTALDKVHHENPMPY